MDKKKQFYDYLEEQKADTQKEIETAMQENRKDEAGFLKAKGNMYDIFKAYFDVAEKAETETAKKIAFFQSKTQSLTGAWKMSLEKAKEHNDTAKIVVEEQKLAAAEEIMAAYKKIMEDER